jgi:hypothetical protein
LASLILCPRARPLAFQLFFREAGGINRLQMLSTPQLARFCGCGLITEMIYVNCRNCDYVLQTRTSWRVENEIKDHIRELHPDLIQKMFDEEGRYQSDLSKIKKPTLSWASYIMVESLPKQFGRQEYGITPKQPLGEFGV